MLRGYLYGLLGFLHQPCYIYFVLIQDRADIFAVLADLSRDCSVGIGYDRNRLELRRYEIFVEFLHCLLIAELFSVEPQPVVVVGGDTVGALKYCADIVFFQPHALQHGICKGRSVLKDAAGEQIINVRNIQRTLYRGYHKLLEFCEDLISYLFVL